MRAGPESRFVEISRKFVVSDVTDPYADGKALSFGCKAQSSLLQFCGCVQARDPEAAA